MGKIKAQGQEEHQNHSQVKHTSGEWNAKPVPSIMTKEGIEMGEYEIHSDGLAKWVATIKVNNEIPAAETVANAKLIAAAPKMLQGLKDIRSQLIDSGLFTEQSLLTISMDELIKSAE